MPDPKNRDIDSWSAFYKFVRDHKDHKWIYRGQTRDWPLATTIERTLNNWEIDMKNATSIEFQTIREFRRRMREPQHHRVHNDTLFCLALMQHHGAPTRLLDCTYSPFAAAAFAMEKGYVCREKPVTGLEPGKPYLLALASEPSGTGALEPLQGFMTNPAGAAIVNAIGPIRQLVRGEDKIPRRYLVILPGTPDEHGAVVQVQKE
jgi:hypothetical protein